MRRAWILSLLSCVGVALLAGLLPAQTVYPTGTTIWNQGTEDGYTLFVGGDGIVYLIDMNGVVVNQWVSPYPGEVFSSVEPLPNGRILVNTGAPYPGVVLKIRELDLDGNILWGYDLPSGSRVNANLHHDSQRLPNGNTLLLCSQDLRVPQISSKLLVDDYIVEVDPAGQEVWSWFTWQHFTEFAFDPEALQLIDAKGGDWAHANSISALPRNSLKDPRFQEGNIIVSQRLTNIIFVIDKTTGSVVWASGPDDHSTFGQHDPHMITQGLMGAGNILVFDNGSGVGYPLRKNAPGFSRVLEIDPLTKGIVWSYSAANSGASVFTFFSNVVSGAQRLPKGNTLICSGVLGRLFEVDQTGQLLWEYMSPYVSSRGGSESLLVFRAYRLPYDWAPGRAPRFKRQ